jgi:dihydrofolate reductase
MKISMIVAVASNGVIGHDGQLPWHLSADLKRFKAITLNSPIIMGRQTFESIGKPLPNRTNIIISRTADYQQPGCRVFNTIEPALAYAGQIAEEIFIIGGSSLYQTLLPYTDTLYLTEIHQEFTGTTFFPAWNKAEWQEIMREDVADDPQVTFGYSFLIYQRKQPSLANHSAENPNNAPTSAQSVS